MLFIFNLTKIRANVFLLSLAVALLVSPVSVRSQVLEAGLRKQLVPALDAYSRARHLTSLSFSLFQGDLTWVDYATGYANTRARIKATPAHLYTIASVTKSITATTLLHLISQGKASLNDPVDHFIASFPKNVTLQDLLNHTSGFLREKENEKFLTDSDYREAVRYLPLKFNLKIHRYANYNYAVAGAVIEAITGRPYAQVASEYFHAVTGAHLYFRNHPRRHSDPRFVTNYVRKGRRLYEHEVVNFGLWEPAAFAQTSAKSLAKFLRYHMTTDFIAFLEAHAVPVHKRRKRQPGKRWETYALGFRLAYVDDELKYIYHNGFLYGVMATMYYFPDKDLGFVALTNMSTYPRQTITLGGLHRHVETAIDRYFNERLVQFTAKNGYIAGVIYFETHQKEGQAHADWIGDAARQYFQKGNTLAALHLLKLNNRLFPDVAETYQSLASAYLKTGKPDLAADTLRKSEFLNSGNVDGPNLKPENDATQGGAERPESEK